MYKKVLTPCHCHTKWHWVAVGRCFLAAWNVSKSVNAFKHDRPKPNLPKRKSIYSFRCSARVLLIGKRLFQDGAMPGKNYPFQGTLQKLFSLAHCFPTKRRKHFKGNSRAHCFPTEHRKHYCKQDKRSSLSFCC